MEVSNETEGMKGMIHPHLFGGYPVFRRSLSLLAPLKISLHIWRFHQIWRLKKCFNLLAQSLLFIKLTGYQA